VSDLNVFGCWDLPKVHAYILINVEVGKTSHVFNELTKIRQATHVSITAGEFDIIVRVTVDDLEELFLITEKVHRIDGIIKTVTHVVEKEIAKAEV